MQTGGLTVVTSTLALILKPPRSAATPQLQDGQ